MKPFEKLLNDNKEWAAKQVAGDPDYFKRLVEIQSPDVLWIGCVQRELILCWRRRSKVSQRAICEIDCDCLNCSHDLYYFMFIVIRLLR